MNSHQRSSESPPLVRTCRQLQELAARFRGSGRSIGLAPTMGALHEGHLSLVRASTQACTATIVTIFVNPSQFGPHEDLEKYPRTLADDLAALAPLGVDAVFCPTVEEMYPATFSTYVDPPRVAQRWEGECRPDHFRGVATVVLKLFLLASADQAFFGQKDFQQAQVIRRMSEDLNLPTCVRVCPIVRESDGLAMSSRNRYLAPEQRERALGLWRSLTLARRLVRSGCREAGNIVKEMTKQLSTQGVDRIDYVAVVDPESLEPVERIEPPTVALIAAHVGTTRLIDNLYLA